VPEFLFRLWVHYAEDSLVPEVVVRANTKMEAAAIALHHFLVMERPLDSYSYLQCEPDDGQYLRVGHVLDWLTTPEGRAFALRHRAQLS
jgi:hypothetical protein